MNWLDKYSEDVPKAQKGKNIPASRQDSLNVYNSAKAVDNYYKNSGRYTRHKWMENPDDLKNFEKDQASARESFKKNKLAVVPTKKGTSELLSNLPLSTFYQKIDDNRYKQREGFNSVMDTRAPMTLYDKRIKPQEVRHYSNRVKEDIMKGDAVGLAQYDPLAVIPYDILKKNPAKLAERIKKYGYDGLPKNLKGDKPAPTKTKDSVRTDSTRPPSRTITPEISDMPRVEQLNLPPMQQMGQSAIIPPGSVRTPKSYNVNMQRYNMEGPSEYYSANEQNIDYEKAMQITNASDAYNQNIEKRYGPQNEYRNPRSAEKAAERFKQLRSESEITPNFKNGGQSTHDGLTTEGFDYNGAWGGQFQMGGSLPGATGHMYSRYEEGGVIKDDRGQWDHPGEITEISGDTMATHGYGDIPLYVVPDKGKPRLVQPNTGIQKFPGAKKFTEYPVAKDGKELVKLNQLTNFTNYNTKQPGGWMDKYQ